MGHVTEIMDDHLRGWSGGGGISEVGVGPGVSVGSSQEINLAWPLPATYPGAHASLDVIASGIAGEPSTASVSPGCIVD